MKNKYSTFFTQTKKVILFIHDFKCYSCGKISFSNHLHHNDKNCRNDDFLNLVPLCSGCHKITHKANITYNFSILTTQEEKLQSLYKLYYIV